MSGLALVMPMAGRGSRFLRDGRVTPKPLIPLAGRPFFHWAAESVRRAAPVREMVFVVLEEHVRGFGIDDAIRACYPDATVVAIAEVTAGAAETAAAGVAALRSTGPFAVNDCDHAFDAGDLGPLVEALGTTLGGALLGFRATSPAYSYAVLDGDGRVRRTVEKEVASPFAVAGCYLFAEPAVFAGLLEQYRTECTYRELFVSGMYNVAVRRELAVGFRELRAHLAFGTPEELAAVSPERLAALWGETARR
jgi:NDP-sugar pyrophosphorylase family protein